MNITYVCNLGGRQERSETRPCGKAAETTNLGVPRVARLLALAIRMQRLVREGTIRDYATAARLGRVTRARMTQITKLLDLAPDIQEQILFSPHIKGLNERNLRPIAKNIDWNEQRRLFRRFAESTDAD